MTMLPEPRPLIDDADSRPLYRWYHKMGGLLYVVFCFEMGVFLFVFPWMDRWEVNYFAWLTARSAAQAEFAQWWHSLWLSPFFRGAVSGLGLINIWLGFSQAWRLRRPPARP